MCALPMNLSDFSSWFLMLCYTQGHCSGQPSSQPAWTLAMAFLKCHQPHASSFQQETQPSRSPHSTQTPTSSIVPLDLWTRCFHHQEHLPIHPPAFNLTGGDGGIPSSGCWLWPPRLSAGLLLGHPQPPALPCLGTPLSIPQQQLICPPPPPSFLRGGQCRFVSRCSEPSGAPGTTPNH